MSPVFVYWLVLPGNISFKEVCMRMVASCQPEDREEETADKDGSQP